MFQQFFVCALNDIAEQVSSQQCFSVEFETVGTNKYISVKFWKNLELCRVYVCRSSLPATDATCKLGSLARILSAVSTRPDMVACSGCLVEFAKTIDQSEYFAQGVQSCFRFEQLSLARLMNKTSYSVFDHIDFSVLQALMVSLGGSLIEDWVIRHPKLTRVSNPIVYSPFHVVLIVKKGE